MDPKFQTSFIPKKPIAQTIGVNVRASGGRGVSIYMTIAVLLFIVSLASVGGAYAWKQYLVGLQGGYVQELAVREKQFNIDSMSQLKAIDVEIGYAKQLLNGHLAVSGIFDIISKLTIDKVRFMNMDLTTPLAQSSDGIKISMQGVGTSLQAVAFQSDVLGQLEQYGLRKIVKNPILSDPSLDANGTVTFGFTATIDPSSLSYERSVSDAGSASGVSASSTSQ